MKNIIESTCDKFKVNYKFVKFLFVGGINTLFGYSIYSLFLFIGLSYPLALLLGTIIALLFNFKTTGKIVFKNSDNRLIFKFLLNYALLYFLNLFFLRIFDLLKINLYLAGFVLLLPMACISFLLMNKFVFGRIKKDE